RLALTQAAARFIGAADLSPEPAAELRAADPADLPQVVRAHVRQITTRAEAAQAVAEAAVAARTAAQRELDEARAVGAALDRRRRLRAELATLAERAPVHAADVERLAAA